MTREDMMDEMKNYFDDKAEVGLFWCDIFKEELFQVHSLPVSELAKGQKTYPKLHKTIWQKLRMKAIQNKDAGREYEDVYLNDYTQVPRGRIFISDGIFYVMTGSWINENIKKAIIEEFNLQDSTVKFNVDKHWEIGRGWSSEMDELAFS
jgi:hypothetical protein